MEPKSKIKWPRSLRMAVAVPLSLPAVIWLAQPGQAPGWNEAGKAFLDAAQSRTLWDWMDLLLLPLLLAGGVLLWKHSQRSNERRRTEQQISLKREIAADHQQEEAIQAYFDRMADLLLKDKLSKFSTDEVRNVARIRTLSVLRGLDPRRKGLVLLFLKDSGLIDREAVIDLCGADLRGASLPYARLGRVNLSEADLRGADLQGTDLSKAYLSGTNLRAAFLVGANLTGTDLFEADLGGADLSRARLSDANLTGADLRGCHLNEANLSEADLSGVNLNVGDLVGANLRGAKLGGARMLGADLREADLSQADLSGTQITNVELEKAKSLEGATLPDGTRHE